MTEQKTDHPITQYITEARKRGMDNAQVIQALTEAGWKTHEILEIVMEHKGPSPLAAQAQPEVADAIISVRNVSKVYGKVVALDNISLSVKRGGVTALLGPNGAGKTTLVKILTTLSQQTSGSATVSGLDVIKQAQQLRSIIGLAGQYAAVDETLTGRENIEMIGRLYHLSKKDAQARANDLLKQFDLEDAADRSAKTYSGGMRRRLDLAASLVIKPQVLFLDEPTTGLDPRSRFLLWDVIRQLVASGTTVLLTTQYMEEADQLADYVFVIDHGHIIAQGTADDLKRQVGGDVLELHLEDHSAAEKTAAIIKHFGSDQPHINPESGVVTLPTSGGASVLVEVVRELDAAQIKLSNIILRRPSLDDVFMKLTGHEAATE